MTFSIKLCRARFENTSQSNGISTRLDAISADNVKKLNAGGVSIKIRSYFSERL